MNENLNYFFVQQGHSLIEILLIFLLLGILLSFTIPVYQSITANAESSAVIDELVNSISLARSEAVRRHQFTGICPSVDGQHCSGIWSNGWIVFVNDTTAAKNISPASILHYFNLLPKGSTLEWRASRTSQYLQIAPNGAPLGQNGRFLFWTAAMKKPSAYQIIISQTGRVRIAKP